MRRGILAAVAAAGFLFPVSAALSQSAPAPQPAPALPPVAAFGRLPDMSDPAIAPDGKHIAFVRSYQGKPVVLVYHLGADQDKPPFYVAAGDVTIDSIQWAKNNRLLVNIVDHTILVSGDVERTVYRTMSVDPDTKEMVGLLGNVDSIQYNPVSSIVADLDPDDATLIYMPLYSGSIGNMAGYYDTISYDLYRVDVTTGHATFVERGNKSVTENTFTTQWLMDGHGRVVGRVDQKVDPLVDTVLIADKDGKLHEWQKFDASGDKGAEIMGVLYDGTALVQYKHDENTGLHGYDLVDFATKKVSPLYYDQTYDVGEVLTDPWTGRIIGASYIADTPQYIYFDKTLEPLRKGVESAFPSLSAKAVSWDRGMNLVAIKVDAPRVPPVYFELDRTTHHATPIGKSYPDLKSTDLGEMKPYPYKARDGLDIPAYITLPPGRIAKNLPAIVMPHGGPNCCRDQIGFNWWAQFYANRGYVVLQPNFRGSSGYGKKFTDAGNKQWGLKMQDDVTDGVEKMIADGIVDPKRICIVGASYGGYAALAGAAFTPDLYACAISFAGISDLQNLYDTNVRETGSLSQPTSYLRLRMGSPDTDSAQWKATSPALHADKVKCPVLLLHGGDDTTVRIGQSQEMYDALNKAHKKVDFIRLPGGDHYLRTADMRIRVLTETEKFLKQNIGN